MDWWTAVVIGIVQGITEWLPVSSSGQSSIILVNGFNLDPRMAITLGLAVHIGTALAVVAKYPKDLLAMADFSGGKIPKFYWAVTIISLICALPFLLLLEATFESNLWTGETITIFVGLALIVTGLIIREQYRRKPKKLSKAGWKDYIILGVAQGFAILPGISRSGMTVSALLVRDYEKSTSMKFSFMLSVPVSFAAAGYFIVFGDMASIGLGPYIVAGLFAFVFGYFTMEILLRMAKQINFSMFCIVFGLMAVIIPSFFWLLG